MRINSKYEKGISFRDLFFHVLYQWRKALAAALVLAAVLGAVQCVSNYKRISQVKDAEPQSASTGLSGINAFMADNYNQSIADYQRMIEGFNEYRANSILMNIDPANEWVATKSYMVKTDTDTDTDTYPVCYAYTRAVYNELGGEEVESAFGTDNYGYIYEVITTAFDYNGNSFEIKIIGSSEEAVTRQLECVSNIVEAYSRSEGQKLGAHEIVEIGKRVYVTADLNLSVTHDTVSKRLVDYQTQIENNRKKISELSGASTVSSAAVKLSTDVLDKAVLGFIIGLVLSIVFFILQYAGKGVLNEEDELREQYDVPVFGAFMSTRAAKSGKGLDRLIEKAEFRDKVTDSDVIYSNICTLIRENGSGKRILLTGTPDKDVLSGVFSELRERLKGENIEAEADFVHNRKAVAESKQADMVILVEKKYLSRKADIERMAEIMRINEANVAGSIIL